MTVISDSTPLIHLSAVSDVSLLRDLFGTIVIPEAVFHEVVTAGKRRAGAYDVAATVGAWIKVEGIACRGRGHGAPEAAGR